MMHVWLANANSSGPLFWPHGLQILTPFLGRLLLSFPLISVPAGVWTRRTSGLRWPFRPQKAALAPDGRHSVRGRSPCFAGWSEGGRAPKKNFRKISLDKRG